MAGPNVAGMPPAHVPVDSALSVVPRTYLIPGFVWKTHDNHTVCPEVTATGLVSGSVCHPAAEATVAAAVTPSRDDGEPDASE